MAAKESSSFGQKLRRLREAAGLTQAELAERAGISIKAVGALESGRRQRPYPSTVHALAAALELPESERYQLTQLLPARGTSETPVHTFHSELPAPPTRLIGRERELADVFDLLDHGSARLVTLTGPGGVGKTRLALEVATRMSPAFSDRVAFISLATLDDPQLAMPEIARVLGVPEVPDVAARDRTATYIGSQPWLLVIDNLEHVLDVATELAALLANCSQLKILTTSRAPLRIRAEHEFIVRPLILPDLSDIPLVGSVAQAGAVQLFVERARASAPQFDLTQANCAAVAAICRRLDGLPLALELVAAKVRALSPTELLARLEFALPLLTGGARDLPQRQQTLQAAIDWSYQLLKAEEQELFRTLSIFQGGWTLAAAEHVSVSEANTNQRVIELLTSLVEQSLVVTEVNADGATRYRMLSTIREYAVQRRDEAGETGCLADLHLDWCLSLVTAASGGLHGPDQHQWLLRLDAEHENFRAALSWSVLDAARKPLALRLAASLWLFWETRGHLNEGRRWLEQALAKSDAQPPSLRADALNGAGNLAYDQGDHERAAALHAASLELRRVIGDEYGVAISLLNLGNVVMDQGDRGRAAELYTEALRHFRQHGSAWDIAHAVNNLGIVLGARGEYERAIALLEEAITLREPMAEAVYQARSLDALGEVMRKKGDLPRARALHEESLALRRTRGDARGVAVSLRNLGLVAFYQGHIDEATTLIEEALELCRDLGNRKGIAQCLSALAKIRQGLGDNEEAAAFYLDALALHRQLGIHDGVVEILVGLALLHTRQKRHAQAAWLLGSADKVCEMTGQRVAAVDQADYVAAVTSTRSALHADEFERAWEAGHALTIPQAIDELLEMATHDPVL